MASTSVVVPSCQLVPFSEIAEKMNLGQKQVEAAYRSAMKKLRARPAVLQQLRDLASGLHNSPITETNEDLD